MAWGCSWASECQGVSSSGWQGGPGGVTEHGFTVEAAEAELGSLPGALLWPWQ